MKASRWFLAAALMIGAAGCANSVGEVNRVQPNVLKKSEILSGHWYLRNTVTWTPATSGFTFTGETGNLEKLVFEIQQGLLVGYRAYPYIPGAEEGVEASSVPSGVTSTYCRNDANNVRQCSGGQKFYGAPVVAYNITSHFDIRREYNTRTGETTNVVSENTTDRPWDEREFIRVNWSTNVLNMGSGVAWNAVQNPAGSSTTSTWIDEGEPGTDPSDWPHAERALTKNAGEVELKYLDFTARYLVRPDETYIEGYGMMPECFLLRGYRYDCTSQEIRIRTSLAKIDPNETLDYEPLVYPNDVMSKFGYFRTERLTYDRRFGVTETGRIFLANRYNIWKKTFERDANGNVDQTKPVPFAQREVKPIVYYVTEASRLGSPEAYKQYLETARILEKGWDGAFRRAVAAAQGKQLSQVPQVLFVCENPVPALDTLTGKPLTEEVKAACGQEGFTARFGDLRYSFLNTITEPVPNGLLGYGPLSADPETGQIISANANTYTGAVDTSAQRTLDVIDLLSGEKSLLDIVSGDDVRRYMMANPAYASVFQHPQAPIRSELPESRSLGGESVGAFSRLTPQAQSVLEGLRAGGGLPSANGDRLAAAAEKMAQHPALEAAFLDNPEMRNDILGLLPSHLATLAESDPQLMRTLTRKAILQYPEIDGFRQRRLDWASRRNMTLEEFSDRPTVHLANKEAGARRARIAALIAAGQSATEARRIADNEIRFRLQQGIWRSTSEHEIGHTFGLRHNFQGSFDAMNYHDEYWALRKPTLTVGQGSTAKLPRTPGDLKAASDGTQQQMDDGIYDYEYSSIMDYAGKVAGDLQGIGKYDEAAILFAYSGGRDPGYVEVFNSARRDDRQFPGSDNRNVTVSGAGTDLPVTNAQHKHPGIPNYTERYHYSLIPLHFGEGADVGSVINDGVEKLRSRQLMKWSDVKAATAKLAQTLQATPTPSTADVANVPLEVPYMFCSDEHVGAVLSCNRFDRGGDYYEITRTKLEDYWNFYFFTHFRRDRHYFTSEPSLNGAYDTFTAVSNVYKHWMNALYKQTNTEQVLPKYPMDATLQDTWSMASFDGLNNLLRVVSVPQSGIYYNNGQTWLNYTSGYEWDDFSPEILAQLEGANPRIQFMVVPRGTGRRMESRYDFKSGFGFWYRMVEAGHYNDQYAAILAAARPEADFLGVDDRADQNRYYVPYYTMFKKEMNGLFSAVWARQESKYRPILYKAYDAYGTLSKFAGVDYGVRVKGSDYIAGFDYPKGEAARVTAQASAPADITNTYTGRYMSLYLGMALFSVNFDYDYAKQNQVFQLGGSESITVGADYESFEAALPNGIRYVAVQPRGSTVDSAAVFMIKQTKAYVDQLGTAPDAQTRAYYQQNLDYTVRDLDLMRGMYSVFGRAF